MTILQGPKGARFGGLQTCGSVWTCAICSSKIVRQREAEIQTALEQHLESGGFALMITLTHSHTRQDRLADLVDSYGKAVRWMTASREYKALMACAGYIGRIRALEVTYGDSSGWHPHGHELHFITRELSDEQIEAFRLDLFRIWSKACMRHGLPAPSEKHGVDVVRAVDAADYISKATSDSKWNAGKELTHSHSKKGRAGVRYTPFDFLRAARTGHRPGQMIELFREYAHAYHGRRQLHWTNGLKAMFGIVETSDDEAAQKVEAEHTVAGTISLYNWRGRVMAQRVDLRPALLDLFERQGMDAVHAYIANLPYVDVRTRERQSMVPIHPFKNTT